MLNIEYKLLNHGWAECVLSDGSKVVTIDGSYVSDCLGSLLQAVNELINGKQKVYANFDNEPGEYRLIFENLGDNIKLTILEFPSLWSNDPDEKGKKVFETMITLFELTNSIYQAANNVLQEYGEVGYKEKWIEHDFPKVVFLLIEKWIKSHKNNS
jgi:hypothetical protein